MLLECAEIMIRFQFAFPKLSAPVGSVLVGSQEFINKAHRGERCLVVAGDKLVLAGAALHALDHHVERSRKITPVQERLQRLLTQWIISV